LALALYIKRIRHEMEEFRTDSVQLFIYKTSDLFIIHSTYVIETAKCGLYYSSSEVQRSREATLM